MRLSVVDTERCVGCQNCMFACTRKEGVGGIGRTRIHVRSVGGMERGFKIIVCRACRDPPCAKACPNDALVTRPDGGVRLISEKCNGCGHCRDACILGAVSWDEEKGKPMICLQCGYCSKYCPHGVLALESGKEGAAPPDDGTTESGGSGGEVK
jgi:carbon-monoxide dehydrogenase iron sulfur subunit